ncbi:MAG: hypothetical protein ACLQMF_05120 [Rectinemataceae bacterium]
MHKPRTFALPALFFAIAGILGSCTPSPAWPTFAVSGTITSDPLLTVSTPVTLTFSSASQTYTLQFSLTSGGSASYSVSGLPGGIYTIAASFSSGILPSSPTYSVNGTPQTTLPITLSSSSGSAPYAVTENVSGLNIFNSETIDIYLGSSY